MKQVKVIIIDDERSAREEIKRLLHPYPAFTVMAEAANADDAETQITAVQPDLIFLDIQMPERSGFDLLESLATVPEVIFTTAFDKYAVQAFEISALDYLMKPIREERFAKAIEKYQEKAEARTGITKQAEEQIFIRDGQQYYFVRWNTVYLIESLDNYARLHFEGKKVLLKSSLNQLEQKLDSTAFFRINRAQIINTQYIQHIRSSDSGRIHITLQTGEQLELSERQSIKFRNSGRMQ